ncbi:hypothetical protein DL98DRAFT_441963, partial [Cadophora sp. DSE1049]
SDLHLARQQVQFFNSYKHFHSVQKPVHKIPYYTLGCLIGFKDVLIYFLFPCFY